MFSLFDFATILPHIAIPIILYVIPESHYAIGNTIVVLNFIFRLPPRK